MEKWKEAIMKLGFPQQQALGPSQNCCLGMQWDGLCRLGVQWDAFLPCELPKDRKANPHFLEPLSLQATVKYSKHIFNIGVFYLLNCKLVLDTDRLEFQTRFAEFMSPFIKKKIYFLLPINIPSIVDL